MKISKVDVSINVGYEALSFFSKKKEAKKMEKNFLQILFFCFTYDLKNTKRKIKS